ncbi:hypothetical protein AHMF7605_10345 [Adhaeribacter arboris]|uniref:Uncharacterized protein n=1 Tax=Adhaeribacter arboris TaxID=2072846 RepID=A0A2T2YEE6_9BACT|nr:hypothetical protein [Adhaeribacter arboris]PSR53887.1 hypothetical protein AHMF7605_10345 [Adhaeribacter arboris]
MQNNSANTLNGRPLTFGDLGQILKAREHYAKSAGQLPVATLGEEYHFDTNTTSLKYDFQCIKTRCQEQHTRALTYKQYYALEDADLDIQCSCGAKYQMRHDDFFVVPESLLPSYFPRKPELPTLFNLNPAKSCVS